MSDTTWSEENSATFIDYGRYFVPQREYQIQTICDLIPAPAAPFGVMELSHGEGLLAEAICERYAQATVYGYDISEEMRHHAAQRLARFGKRFQTRFFDLQALEWRTPAFTPQAVVTSLTVHHLDGAGKCRLFADMEAILAPGGSFIVADLIQPTNELANAVAAKAWDKSVQARAHQFGQDGAIVAQFEALEWNLFRHPDPEFDKPSPLVDQLNWLAEAGFTAVDVFWLHAGHAIYGGSKRA